jgi:hypothetical protein
LKDFKDFLALFKCTTSIRGHSSTWRDQGRLTHAEKSSRITSSTTTGQSVNEPAEHIPTTDRISMYNPFHAPCLDRNVENTGKIEPVLYIPVPMETILYTFVLVGIPPLLWHSRKPVTVLGVIPFASWICRSSLRRRRLSIRSFCRELHSHVVLPGAHITTSISVN